jgi:hypothetical protein
VDNRDRNDNMCSTVVAGVVAGEEKKLIGFRTAYRKSDGNLVKISGTASPLPCPLPCTALATLMVTHGNSHGNNPCNPVVPRRLWDL